MKRSATMNQQAYSRSWFADPDHRPFHLNGALGGALLIYGYMGTPREMLPIARTLQSCGYESIGPLLPGFGDQLRHHHRVTRHDWIAEAENSWAALSTARKADVLIGFSMGASIAMEQAVRRPPRQLILISPLWKVMGDDWKLKLLPVVKRIVQTIRPFARADFDDPGVRQFVSGAMPDIDLADPGVQRFLRQEVRCSTATIDDLRRLASRSGELAPQIAAPTLVIQGTNDETVRPVDTRELVARMGTNATLRELSGGHLIVSDRESSWSQVEKLILDHTGIGSAA